jgi:hypothetical protein
MVINADDERQISDINDNTGADTNGVNKKAILLQENKTLTQKVKDCETVITGLQKELQSSKLEIVTAKEDCVQVNTVYLYQLT